MTQVQKVYDYMNEHGAITQRDAFHLGIYRLSARIADLKSAGINVQSELVQVECADGSKARVARYWLPEVKG